MGGSMSRNDPESESMPLCIGGGYGVLDKCLCGLVERQRLMHEIAHCETATMYYTDTPKALIAQCEYHADAYAYRTFLPPEVI